MPINYTNNELEARHTDDMQDIITAVPSWLLRWGIILLFGVLVFIVALSAFIRYPDIVKAQLKIDSPNSPKPVVAKISGKLIKLLVAENETVKQGQPLAYLESTTDHDKVLNLLVGLNNLRQQLINNKPINIKLFSQIGDIQFGEIQPTYQAFYNEYLIFISSVNNGFLLKKSAYLHSDLANISKQQQQLKAEKVIEQRDFSLAQQDFDMHKKLLEGKVESLAEYRQEESKYLAKKSPLVQTESSIINGNNNYIAIQKEILELDNQLQEESGKFLQALNSLVSAARDWKSKYILTASQDGKLNYAGIVQVNQELIANQEVFYINPGDEQFFGEMPIFQDNMGKVKEGQQVLIKLKGYPFEEYGMIRGRINHISDIPYKDSIFMAKVDFKIKKASDIKKPIHLKQGMMANAEIITQDATLLQRISRSLLKIRDDK